MILTDYYRQLAGRALVVLLVTYVLVFGGTFNGMLNLPFPVISLLLLTILAAIWLGMWFAERLSRPVGRLAGAAQRVGAGDLDVRVIEERGDSPFRIEEHVAVQHAAGPRQDQDAGGELPHASDEDPGGLFLVGPDPPTVAPARVLGIEGDYGCLEPGRLAAWAVLPEDFEAML